MSKEDLHIEILKYGKDKLETGVTFDELRTHIKNLGYEVSEYRMRHYLNDNYVIMENEYQGQPWEAMDKGLKFTLSVESTFRLIEYNEFKSANRSSRIATRFATAALLVSIASAWASIHFSMKQLDSETIINTNQLSELLKLKYDDKNIDKNTKTMINNQNLIIQELQNHKTPEGIVNNQKNIIKALQVNRKLLEATKKPKQALNSDAQKTRAR